MSEKGGTVHTEDDLNGEVAIMFAKESACIVRAFEHMLDEASSEHKPFLNELYRKNMGLFHAYLKTRVASERNNCLNPHTTSFKSGHVNDTQQSTDYSVDTSNEFPCLTDTNYASVVGKKTEPTTEIKKSSSEIKKSNPEITVPDSLKSLEGQTFDGYICNGGDDTFRFIAFDDKTLRNTFGNFYHRIGNGKLQMFDADKYRPYKMCKFEIIFSEYTKQHIARVTEIRNEYKKTFD